MLQMLRRGVRPMARACSLVDSTPTAGGVRADVLLDAISAQVADTCPQATIRVSAPAVELATGTVTPLALVLSELLARLIEEARPRSATTLSVSLRRRGEEFRLTVRRAAPGQIQHSPALRPVDRSDLHHLCRQLGETSITEIGEDLEIQVQLPSTPA